MSEAYIVTTPLDFRDAMKEAIYEFRLKNPTDEEMNSFVLELDAAVRYFTTYKFHVPTRIIKRLYMGM